MSAIETASPRASFSASETAPRISEDGCPYCILILFEKLAIRGSYQQG